MTTPVSYSAHPAAALFPLLADEELTDLAEDIRVNGLIEPVWLYDDPEHGRMLLDGRNRSRACELAGVPVATRLYTGDDPIAFSLSQNLKRRHLTSGQRDFLALDVEKLYAEEAARDKARAIAAAAAQRQRDESGRLIAERKRQMTADLPSSGDDEPSNEPVQTQPDLSARLPQHIAQEVAARKARESRERAAKVAGTSGRGVSQAKRVANAAPDLAEKVKAGTLAIDRAERIVRDREAEQRRIQQARREAEQAEVKATVDIRRGDFREVLADLTGVDAIITDPPYPHEFIPLLGDLATWADKVLAPDGVMAVLIGQMYLPEVYRLLDTGRPYRWTGCYLTSGPGYVSHPRRVSSNWKPLIVYGGGPRFADVIRSEGTDAHAKSLHKWGQDYNAFHTIIERLTERGQTVVDPFMGAGTTLLAAHALGRNAVGCDVDATHVATARERLT